MVPWSIYILTFLYNFTFGALVGESPRAGAIDDDGRTDGRTDDDDGQTTTDGRQKSHWGQNSNAAIKWP